MDDAQKMLLEKAFGLVMDDHVMQDVEKLGGFHYDPKFFGELADDRFFMPLAMVDSASGQIEFPRQGSARLADEHDSSVMQRNDGIGAGADGKDVGHGKGS